jgi:uncharacterized protein (DUF779 family)
MSDYRIPTLQASDAARRAVRRVVAAHGPVMFIQSAGCCDGSAPMCFPVTEFLTGEADIQIGQVEGCPIYIAELQLAAWSHPDLLLDVEPGYADGLSLEAGDGLHFITTYLPADPAQPTPSTT